MSGGWTSQKITNQRSDAQIQVANMTWGPEVVSGSSGGCRRANQSNPWIPVISCMYKNYVHVPPKNWKNMDSMSFRLAKHWQCWIGKLDQVPEAWLQPQTPSKLLRISTGMRQTWPKHGICKINVHLCRQEWPLRNGCCATNMFKGVGGPVFGSLAPELFGWNPGKGFIQPSTVGVNPPSTHNLRNPKREAKFRQTFTFIKIGLVLVCFGKS